MPIPLVVTDANFRAVPTATVAICPSLQGPWTTVPYLFCDRLKVTVGPEIDEASLRFEYGQLMQFDQSTFKAYLPQGNNSPLTGQFVQVTISDTINSPAVPIVWYGVIETDERQALGDSCGESGTQMFTAYGLARLLERAIVRTSVVWQNATATTLLIPRALPFNAPRSGYFLPRGNRNSTLQTINGQSTYVFSDEPAGEAEWTAWSALIYLLAVNVPTDTAGNPVATWSLSGDPNTVGWFRLALETDGKTLKELLDHLVNRKRGTGYYVSFAADATPPGMGTLTINCFTHAIADVALPSGATLKANPAQYTLDFENSVDMRQSVLINSWTTRYDRIIVRGERKTTTCTLLANQLISQIDKGWTASDVTSYLAAASGDTDYGTLDLVEQYRRNAIYRSGDGIRQTFCRFLIKPSWNQQVFDPESATPHIPSWVAPTYDASGVPLQPVDAANSTGTVGEPFWTRGLTLRHKLPLYEQANYSGTYISSTTYTGIDPASDGQLDFLSPFACILTAAGGAANGADRWEMTDRLSTGAALETGGRRWSASLQILDRSAGVDLRVAGAPQHFLAGADWPGAPAAAAFDPRDDPALANGLDYQNLRLTLCLELDSRVSVELLTNGGTATNVPERVLLIEVRDARLDYIVPGTVVALVDGQLVKSTSGGFVRDDRQRLNDIAAAADLWYGTLRQALTVQFRAVRNVFPSGLGLGSLITSVGADYSVPSVNSVVSSVEFHLLMPATVIHTQYAELDFSAESSSAPHSSYA